MNLVLFGIQGSGKGTQAKKLAAEFDYQIFEAGGALRSIAASGSELGETVKSYIDHGKLVPFEIIMKVVEEAIGKIPKEQKILFDGIPRDLDQMKRLNEILEKGEREFRCLHITLDPEEGIRRILKRAEIEGRADDASEETIRRRMDLFLEKTMPVIEAYEQAGKITAIEGTGTVEEIFERIVAALELHS